MENKIQDKIFLAPEERVALIERKLERARVQVDAMIAQMEAECFCLTLCTTHFRTRRKFSALQQILQFIRTVDTHFQQV